MSNARRLPRQHLFAWSGLLLLTLGVRLAPAWLLKNEVSDIQTYRTMAHAVRNGDNVYAYPITFPYVPYSQFLPAWALALAERTGWSFDFAIKLLPILADACTTLLIFGYLQWRLVPLRISVTWTLTWALNPISILISAFHGNIMAAVPFLVLASYVSSQIGEASRNRDLLLPISALLLGLAIAMRTYPVLLLPAFLMLFTRTAKEMIVFTSLASFPAGLSSLPYLLFARHTFLREVGGYSGFTDFGWLSVLRAPAYILGGHSYVAADAALLGQTKQLFLGGYLLVCLTMPFFRQSALARALLIAPLLFYALYGGVSAQYFVWVLPFAAIARQRLTFPFTVAGTVALVTFYSIYHPGILAGRFALPINGHDPTVWVLYAAANAILVVLSLAWAARIAGAELRSYLRTRRPAAVPWLQKARWLCSSRGYGALLLLGSVGWLAIAWRTVQRAYDVGRAMLH